MGYEIKLFVVEEHNMTKNKIWAEKIATFDLAKCPLGPDLFTEDAKGFIFAEDGNEKITEDNYGEPMKVDTIENVLAALKRAAKESDYRRLKPCIKLLEGFKAELDKGSWDADRLKVYHFGY